MKTIESNGSVSSATWVALFALAAANGQPLAAQASPRRTLELADYAQMPITGDPNGQNTRGQLARVNYMRDEPGGRRFFVNDLNGPLYIVDKDTKTFTTYLDFNALGGRPGLFPKFTFERNFATGLTNFIFDPEHNRATDIRLRFSARARLHFDVSLQQRRR